ncbi:MAG: hypothetical protein OEY14_11880 [Myxococcales bacterium]|nr:hypothetical protein [Myxococcales bacterium]
MTVYQMSATLEMVEASHSLPQAYDRCIEFMLEGLALVRNTLVPPVKAGLETAERYWRTGEKDVSLERAKVALWKELDSGDIHGPAEAGARAVLCTLEPTAPTDDIFELLDWYTQFLADAGGRPGKIISLMQKHFLSD